MKTYEEFINERVWYDQISSWFGRQVYRKDYEDALKTLVKMIKRKEKSGEIRHDIAYYAKRIADTYANVDGYELANAYKEVFES